MRWTSFSIMRDFLSTAGWGLLLSGAALGAYLIILIIRLPPDPEGLGLGLLIFALVSISLPTSLVGAGMIYLARRMQPESGDNV